MSIQHFPGPRGIMAVRADASDADKILAELLPAFKAFKDENDKALADLRKGKADVVQTEKIDRINADITSLQAGIDQVNAALAAARVVKPGGQVVLHDAYDGGLVGGAVLWCGLSVG
jgi:predicted phage gp36 major capsid-like protein